MSENEERTDGEQAVDEAVAGQVPIDQIDDVDQLRDEFAQANDRALRAAAELENFRRRARQQIDDERRYASVPLLQGLLPVLDNIDRAIEAADGSSGGEGLLEGFKIVASQMLGVLAQFHCEPIDALGQPFDPNWHEAIQQMPSDEYESGTVMMVTETGYKVHDRVVRPAKVVVSTGPAGAQ
ncbi:MAG: nucleotide exchange factor GrpE [Pirellulales bacterium]|nr:nucleotide exchange factor GrpE [Pirellulales bacterium]